MIHGLSGGEWQVMTAAECCFCRVIAPGALSGDASRQLDQTIGQFVGWVAKEEHDADIYD